MASMGCNMAAMGCNMVKNASRMASTGCNVASTGCKTASSIAQKRQYGLDGVEKCYKKLWKTTGFDGVQKCCKKTPKTTRWPRRDAKRLQQKQKRLLICCFRGVRRQAHLRNQRQNQIFEKTYKSISKSKSKPDLRKDIQKDTRNNEDAHTLLSRPSESYQISRTCICAGPP